jgi:hypothetical protein
MSLRMVMACAGALVCAAVGCAPNSFLTPFGRAPGEKQVVTIPPGEVAAMLETGLNQNGIHVLTKNYAGAEIRVVGKTKSDKVFCIYLTRDKDSRGDKTVVNLCWDRGADESLWPIVASILAAPPPEPDDPPPSADEPH